MDYDMIYIYQEVLQLQKLPDGKIELVKVSENVDSFEHGLYHKFMNHNTITTEKNKFIKC